LRHYTADVPQQVVTQEAVAFCISQLSANGVKKLDVHVREIIDRSKVGNLLDELG